MDIEREIDFKVYEWFETKNSIFKRYETEKIIEFNKEVITFLESLKLHPKHKTIKSFMRNTIISRKIEHYNNINAELSNMKFMDDDFVISKQIEFLTKN